MHQYLSRLRAAVGHEPLILAGACVILVDPEGRVLLQLRRDNASWGLPGGLLEPGESLEAAARREVREETGLEVGDLQLYGVYSGPEVRYEYPNGDVVHNVTVAYVARQYEGRLRPDGAEGLRVAFSDCDALPEAISAPLLPVVRDLVRDARTGTFCAK